MMLDPRPSDTFHPGDILNNTYSVEGILGRGGTSEVYLARSEISGRVVALKVLNAELSKDAENLLLMTREEEIRDVRHDAVVRYSENNRTPDNHVYLVMDYVEGPRLDEVMSQRDLSIEELLAIAARIADGLVATHARKIIHRDLSPDNIILRYGNASEAMIIDFGIARDTSLDAETIVGGGFAGKYAYAAPEQLSGDADERTDLYALGALLLAAYRGEPPKIGANLLEAVEAKKRPLDVSGVPVPLKSIIERLAAPDPNDRPESAAEALMLIDPDRNTLETTAGPTFVGVGSERTVVAKRSEPSKRSLRPVPLSGIVVVLLAGLGAGAYLSGLPAGVFGPSYPAAEPYTLEIVKRPDAAPELSGHAPSTAVKEAFEQLMADLGGTATIDLASGTLPEDWGTGVLEIADRLSGLDDWKLSFSGGRFEVEGIVIAAGDKDRLSAAFAPEALPEGFLGDAVFAIGPRELPVARIEQVLSSHSDCGDLVLLDPPPVSYTLGQRIFVEGPVASQDTVDRLYLALTQAAGDRPVILDTNVVNEQLCIIDARLAGLVQRVSGVTTFGDDPAIVLSEGILGEPRPNGRFREGDNPVIDLVLPEGMNEGYLWVTLIDVTGSAFHLLPNLRNPENDVPTIRAESGDTFRLSYPLGTEGKVVFQVDATSGKSKVLVFHASAPLFGTPRPTSESIAGFARALEERMAAGALEVYSLVEQIIETE